MKRILGAALVAATFVTPALAADLIVETEIYEEAIAAHDWNGGYVGGFVGYGWGTAGWDFIGGGTAVDVPISGWLVGVDAGANYQTGNFVLGVEGDVAWSGITGTAPCPNPAFDCTTSVQWLGTLRGRAGFAADSMLLYATAGLAVGGVSSDSPPFTPGVTFDNTYVGWTAGGGVEVAVTEDVSLKAEYLYVDLGSATDTGLVLDGAGDTAVGVTMHTVKAGLNWHF